MQIDGDTYAILKSKGLVTLTKISNGVVRLNVTQFDQYGTQTVVPYTITSAEATTAKTDLQAKVANLTTYISDLQAAV
jgi:hypothetical protein